jgi:hypothetical protein
MMTDQQPDPRHSAIRARIAERYAEANDALPLPWTGRTGFILSKILKSNPSWPLEAFLRCVDNRFASDNVNVSADPISWLHGPKEYLVGYAKAPLDAYGKPKKVRGVPARDVLDGFENAADYFIRRERVQ